MKELIYNNQKVLKVEWISGSGTVGLIYTIDTITNKEHVYVGPVQPPTVIGRVFLVYGDSSPEDDMKYILNHGAKMSKEYFERFIKDFLTIDKSNL